MAQAMTAIERPDAVARREARAAASAVRPVTGSAVSLESISKSYASVAAVNDIDLSIAPGEFVSILGPSGSGKSTLLKLLAGFESPDAGRVRIDNADVTATPPYQRNLGMVFQNYALFPHMTVFENVAYALRVRKVPGAEIERRVSAALDMVRLSARDYAARYPAQLSGGQQQRVALVRALVYEPKVLLMDEPMGALDKNLRSELQLELRALQDRLGVTIIYVTHDQDEALMLSDRTAIMRQGRIEQIDTPKALYDRPRNTFVAKFLGEANLIPAVPSGNGRVSFGNGRSIPVAEESLAAIRGTFAVLVRPEHVVLAAPGEAVATGKVDEVIFCGATTRLFAETDIGRIHLVARSDSAQGLRKGDSVGVAFERANPIPLAD